MSHSLPEITKVEHLVLHPWEALIVHVAGERLRQSDIDGIKERVVALLPRGAKVIVVTERITFEVVTAPESAGETGDSE